MGEPLVKNGSVMSEPWDASTKIGLERRKALDEAWRQVGEKLGLTPAEVQERMWDYEQQLYVRHGAIEASGSMSDGVQSAIERLRSGDRVEEYQAYRPAEATEGRRSRIWDALLALRRKVFAPRPDEAGGREKAGSTDCTHASAVCACLAGNKLHPPDYTMRRVVSSRVAMCLTVVCSSLAVNSGCANLRPLPRPLQFGPFPVISRQDMDVEVPSASVGEKGRLVRGCTVVFDSPIEKVLPMADEHLKREHFVRESFPIKSWIYYENSNEEVVVVMRGRRTSPSGRFGNLNQTTALYYRPIGTGSI